MSVAAISKSNPSLTQRVGMNSALWNVSGLIAIHKEVSRNPTRVYPGGPRASAPLEIRLSRNSPRQWLDGADQFSHLAPRDEPCKMHVAQLGPAAILRQHQ